MTTLGIIAALRDEARMFATESDDTGPVMRAHDNVLVYVAGVGAARAQAAARELLAHGATALVSWGVAAALDPRLAPGNIVLPALVLCADGGALPVHVRWHARVREHMPANTGMHVAPLAETHSILAQPATKLELGRARGAVAADMESAAIGQVARERGAPFLAVRAIADDASMTLPAWLAHCLNAAGHVQAARFGASLLRNPRDLAKVMRMACAFSAALAALRRFKSDHLQHLVATG